MNDEEKKEGLANNQQTEKMISEAIEDSLAERETVDQVTETEEIVEEDEAEEPAPKTSHSSKLVLLSIILLLLAAAIYFQKPLINKARDYYLTTKFMIKNRGYKIPKDAKEVKKIELNLDEVKSEK